MTEVPEKAIRAAMTAVMARHGELEEAGHEVIPYEMGEFRADIVTALSAGSPEIAAAERARITAQLAEYRFHGRCTDPDCPEAYHVRPALIGDSDGEG
jgi:hypothetical protein